MKKSIFEKKIDIFALLLVSVFFIYCFIAHPMTELGDSFQYLTQLPSREPVYALLLWILQKVFSNYEIPLSLLQNGLAIIGLYWTYGRISRLYSIKSLYRPLVMVALLAPYIITPAASQSHMYITCSVLTEGIGLALYYIWMAMVLSLILGYYGKDAKKGLILILLLSIFMSMIRGQFIICIAIWFLAMLYIMIKAGSYKKIVLYTAIMILCFAGQNLLTRCYHYAMSDVFTTTVSSKPMLLSNIIYVAKEEDADVIEDERLKSAFLKMLSDSKERELTSDYAKGSIIDRARFHESGHEVINFDCVTMELNELIYELEGKDESNFESFLVYRDKYADKLIKASFSKVLPAYIKNYFVIASLGFVRSIAVEKGVLVIYALIAYICALAATVFLFIRNKNSRAAIFMTLILVAICGSVFGTSLMIECLSRYMIYNLPFFYIAALTILSELITVLRKNK